VNHACIADVPSIKFKCVCLLYCTNFPLPSLFLFTFMEKKIGISCILVEILHSPMGCYIHTVILVCTARIRIVPCIKGFIINSLDTRDLQLRLHLE
jgi:hypothetical protein